MSPVIGFMQGRLSPIEDGKIQAFPWNHWQAEFPAAQAHGFSLMEWTLDRARLFENPLMNEAGRNEIRALSAKHGVKVGSLTGDIFMQAPFWKADGAERRQRLVEFDAVCEACAGTGVGIVVVPLVDNGAMANADEEDLVIVELTRRARIFQVRGQRIVFECDYAPARLAQFIARLPADTFGINYDIGNSAALGYDCAEEIGAYSRRVVNVHIKDRVLGGTTVPLGTGNADLPRALRLLVKSGYRGSYILQTARAKDGDHAGTLARYRDMASRWLAEGVS
jgi:L-ribulose-5-phosphate 3-epimerase